MGPKLEKRIYGKFIVEEGGDVLGAKKLRVLSSIRGLKNLLGVGPHLLLLGLFLEGLTIVIQQWVSFPIQSDFKIQILLTIPCVVACLLGMIWFNH